MTPQEQVKKVHYIVSGLPIQPGQYEDDYFPTIEDLDRVGTMDEYGNMHYSEYDLAFLLWAQNPLFPHKLTEEQKEALRYAAQLLADYQDPSNIGVTPEMLAKYANSDNTKLTKAQILQNWQDQHRKKF